MAQYIVSPLNVSLQTYVTTQVAVIHLSEDVLNATKVYFFSKSSRGSKAFCWAEYV